MAVITPLGDRIVVENQSAEQTTKGGIVLPDTAQEKPQIGKVIAVGAGRITDEGKKIPMEIAVGDVVVFAKYGGTEIKIDSHEFIILKETDVLAKKVN